MSATSPKSARGREVEPAHILAINNDQAVLDHIRELLEAEGYRVTTQAHVGIDSGAIERLGPELIILDYTRTEEDAG